MLFESDGGSLGYVAAVPVISVDLNICVAQAQPGHLAVLVIYLFIALRALRYTSALWCRNLNLWKILTFFVCNKETMYVKWIMHWMQTTCEGWSCRPTKYNSSMFDVSRKSSSKSSFNRNAGNRYYSNYFGYIQKLFRRKYEHKSIIRSVRACCNFLEQFMSRHQFISWFLRFCKPNTKTSHFVHCNQILNAIWYCVALMFCLSLRTLHFLVQHSCLLLHEHSPCFAVYFYHYHYHHSYAILHICNVILWS